MTTGFGTSARRSEDQRLVSGHGRYVDDISLPRQAWGVVVRATVAAGRITAIDADEARQMPGVLAVLTGEDVRADGLGPLKLGATITGADGKPPIEPPRMPLAIEQVGHVGDPVAFVVAETQARAQDAAESVLVEYDSLPAVTEADAAVAADAPVVWEQAPGNVSFRWENGDGEATDGAFERAAHVARVRIHNRRLVANPMEPRGAVGTWDAGTGSYTLYTSTQGSHIIRSLLARGVFGIDESRVRVVTPDVGGAFGMKLYLYPEQALVLWASKRLGRPVKWTSGRAEAFLSDAQGRDQVSDAELAMDSEGRFLGLRVRTLANLGAYLSTLAPLIPTAGGTRALTGTYAIPAAHVHVTGVFTNTVPVDAYRGAGRPESVYLIERLVERAARDLGIASPELRRRNLVPAEAMPYTTALGQVMDSGDFARNMDDAMARADWDGFENRRAESAGRGMLRGIGMTTYMEPCAGNRDQFAQIRFNPGGSAVVMIGTQSTGQGHETAYAQLVSQWLGVPMEHVRVLQGDTGEVAYGRGTSGSRSLPIGGTALYHAGQRIIAKAKRIAAHVLEAAEADIEFRDGKFHVAGTDRSIGMQEIVETAYTPGVLPDDIDMGLDEHAHYMARPTTFPNGCHVCELEVDPDTGRTSILRYTVVDDFGRILNPMMVEGQVHGGIAQGIGQALIEECVYDAESGQLVTGSFMDYGMPRAVDLPRYEFSTNEVPCTTNPLGMKGCGEAGAIAAPPVVIAALEDALRPAGVESIEMPATPMRVWQALEDARRGRRRG